MLDPFQLPFVQRGLVELLILSVGAGLLGTWIVLRGLAFFSHAIGPAAFPGLVVADGLGFAAPLGALGAALLFAGSVGQLARGRHARYDNLTALVLTGALALGVLLASDVFHSGTNVDNLLFGSLLLVEPRDVVLAAAASGVALAATLVFGSVWLASGFDEEGARALGVRSGAAEAALLVLIALVVIASLSALGALLATALLVVPAATTRLWLNRLPPWQIATVVLTAAEGVAGIWLSVKLNAPPGATIATLSGVLFALAAVARAGLRARRARLAVAIVALPVIAALPGCAGSSTGGGGKPDVVATTTQIGDWVRQVGGDDVDVHQILKANTDPHEYEPRPADVQAAAGADVVFTNGDNLDHWASRLVDEAGGDPDQVELADGLSDQLPGEKSGPEKSAHDPHWWHDPTNAVAAVGEIATALERADPPARARIARRARAYVAKLHTLDRQIGDCLGKIPASRRKLVTDHDAFGYFARRYGIEVIGAVIPSQTTEGQPSARELSRLIDEIRRAHLAAVFPESSLSPKLARAIAHETGAVSDLTLYGDTLGPDGSDGATYLEMEASNARKIAFGLSGGRVRCSIRPGRE
jgi:ABC-type Zn uptake system ZnuABC Zn-binding protein ZnuA/ABC-type Mn2+/Zn2+ transport system permease subunit